MNELEDYRSMLLSRFLSENGSNGANYYETVLQYVSELLVGAESIPEEIHYTHYEGMGSDGRKKIQIHGYAYNDYDSCLNLYMVTYPDFMGESESLTSDEITRYFSRIKSFVTDVDFIISKAEESHPAYGLAVDIRNNNFEDLKKYKVTIVTDRTLTRNYKVPETEIFEGKKIEYSILDIERLYQIENSLNGKEILTIDLDDMTGGNGIPCMRANSTGDYVSYLCNIPGRVLADIYNEHGSRLLEGNVRSFLQKRNKVNAGIRQTILKEPENFFVYNNGITATATEIEFQEGEEDRVISSITNLQIVNGGQTTASLASCLLTDRKYDSVAKISQIFVPMKLTVISYEKAMDLVPNIAKYANSQNKVTNADLESNAGFHVKMEEISRRLITPITPGSSSGTYWFYERARGQYKQSTYKKTDAERKKFEKLNPRRQLITKTDLVKFVSIRDMRPDIASLGGEKAFFKVNDKLAAAWKADASQFNDLFFQEIVGIDILFKDVDSIVKRKGHNYKANINAYTISLLLYLISRQFPGFSLDYKNIWNRQDVPELLHREMERLTDHVYGSLTDSGRPIENVTEWAKREACWNKMQTLEIELDPGVKYSLISNKMYDARKDDASSKAKELTADQAMMEVVRYGGPNWEKLLYWNKTVGMFTDAEAQIIEKAVYVEKAKMPTGKQCITLVKCLERARNEGGYLD